MKVLILTEPDDIHAALVKVALENLGQECLLMFTADMPSKQKNSLNFENDCYSWFSEDQRTTQQLSSHWDVIWWRRPRRPFVENINPRDKLFIQKENSAFFNSIPFMLDESAWCINPFIHQERANSKLFQLKIAPRHGLKIPETLVSNSPQQIKEFISTNIADGVIYKAFYPHSWYEKDKLKLAYTEEVNPVILPNDEILQLAPGIFQKRIKKAYELRVTCFGNNFLAVKINSQQNYNGLIDWRKIPATELSIEPYHLPAKLGTKISQYMQALGLVFGCLDFIVTPENEFYFLEVNPQGQFLWIEDYLPETAILDKFVQFILARSVHFSWHNLHLKQHDLESQALALLRENMQYHVLSANNGKLNSAA